MTAKVLDNPSEHRFEVHVDDELAGFTEYRATGDGVYTFNHTEVADAFEGQGLGSQLIAAALDTMRERGIAVIPTCPFVRAYIERHPDYGDLIAPGDSRS